MLDNQHGLLVETLHGERRQQRTVDAAISCRARPSGLSEMLDEPENPNFPFLSTDPKSKP